MARWLAGSMLALALTVLSVGPARASDFPAVDRAQVKVTAAVRLLTEADERLARTRSKQDELAHRIAALKRLRSEKRFSEDAALEKLLQQSVEGEKALALDTKRRDSLAADVDAAAADAIKAVDAEIAKRKPALKSGSLEERKATAAQLKSLLQIRNELKNGQSGPAKASGRVTPEAWARYAKVAIGPLDGPRELREKADFIEDARDKLRKKREALAALVRDAQQERDLHKAFNRFRQETSLFDEEARSARVTRLGNNNRLAAAADNNSAAETQGKQGSTTNSPAAAPAQGPGGEGAAGRGAGSQNPTPATGAVSDPNQSADFNSNPPAAPTDDTGASESPTPSTPPAAPPSAIASGGVGAAPPPKALDPNVLLSLRVEDLGAMQTDVAQLEALLRELSGLDSYLTERAGEIRSRAQRLEEDEKKALDK